MDDYEKQLVRVAAGRRIRDHGIARPPCSRCGSTRAVVAHHPDYTQPFDVVWLCSSCHKRHHNGAFEVDGPVVHLERRERIPLLVLTAPAAQVAMRDRGDRLREWIGG